MNKDGCVLIIEDDEKNRKLLYDLFQIKGYMVFEAYNGQEGVDLAKNKIPLLIGVELANAHDWRK